MARAPDEITQKLDLARRDLLDLGLRNPLLNYRLTRRRGVTIVEEKSREVYRMMVAEQKMMAFLPASDDEELDSLFAQPEEEDSDDLAARHVDRFLQTDVGSVELQRRLRATSADARSSIEETGVNILYLALGMLTWYEDDHSELARVAPLLLIPVALERKSVEQPFHVTWTGDEVGENLSLAMKLKMDFDVDYPEWSPDGEVGADSYLRRIATAVAPLRRWSVDRDAMALGFFSFAKFLMYRDLDSEVWPDDGSPGSHETICSLLDETAGFPPHDCPISEDDHLDQHLTPDQTYHVLDADSTQCLALLDCGRGMDMVIQGPPGTGKSQTITNLLSDAVVSGKHVLFVSEKMAALEVVKRRLDHIGIGDACLELHSNKTNKKAVLDELKRTLELGKPRVASVEADLQLLKQQRDRLNAYCEAVNEPIRDSEVSPYAAMGEVLRAREHLAGEMPPDLRVDAMSTWNPPEFRRLERLVNELQARLETMGSPSSHPFRTSKRTSILPSEYSALEASLDRLNGQLKTLQESVRQLADLIGSVVPQSIVEVQQLALLADRLPAAPSLEGMHIETSLWVKGADELQSFIDAGRRLAEARALYGSKLLPEAWDASLAETKKALSAHKDHWWRFMSGEYRRAAAAATALGTDRPASRGELLEWVDLIIQCQADAALLDSSTGLADETLGSAWHGERVDWPELERALSWLRDMHAGVADKSLPPDSAATAARLQGRCPAGLREASGQVSLNVEHAMQALTDAGEKLELDDPRLKAAHGTDLGLDGLERDAAGWRKSLPRLQEVASFNLAASECDAEGLRVVSEAARTWPAASSSLTAAFSKSYHETLLDIAFTERMPLSHFDASAYGRLIKDFRELDEVILRLNRARVLLAHWKQLPRQDGGGQLQTLRHEFNKQKRHMPLRKLMTQAGRAVQAIKPVFMMSPLSVATYLPPGLLTFDLIVFDEASQVRPVDAFGAILRGRQTVVVGDSRQLPPTAFFDTVSQEDNEAEEATTKDIPDILSLFEGQGAHSRMLRWHYRSRHDSLIAVSNSQFYENRLVVFPSPHPRDGRLGLSFRHLPHTAYERATSRTNPLEAREVAQAVMAHAASVPGKTLGVAAFSKAQAERIEDELELLRRQDPSCEAFFAAHPAEPFFVKNLENVQGDERDVIMISVGYGRTAEGYIAMQFGPLLQDGGWRRLNVLITRARERCEVFSNLTADDIDLARTDSRGVAALKTFLNYAQHGIIDAPTDADGQPESPFEEEVSARLQRDDYGVVHQVGSGGFFVDMGIRDPEHPGGYLLGIECDGASYHSARSARDRDRLRQQVLEGLGWRIHRIWSTDWFRNPDAQYKRLTEAIESARLHEDEPPDRDDMALDVEPPEAGAAGAVPANPLVPGPNGRNGWGEPVAERPDRVDDETPQDARTSVPYVKATTRRYPVSANDFQVLSRSQLAVDLREIVTSEGPIHRDLAARRLAHAYGLQRVGGRIDEKVETAVQYVSRGRGVIRKGAFLWPDNMQKPPLRDRSSVDQAEKKIEYVSPEEIAEAVIVAVKNSFGMAEEDVSVEVARLLGFNRTGRDIRSTVEGVLASLLADASLERVGGQIVLPSNQD